MSALRMSLIEITFRGMSASPSVEAAIERWVRRLEHVSDAIEHCAVVVERPHARQPYFEVRLAVTVSDQPRIVVRGPGGITDVYVAVSDAFRAGRRLLVDARRSHDQPPMAPRRVLDGPPSDGAQSSCAAS